MTRHEERVQWLLTLLAAPIDVIAVIDGWQHVIVSKQIYQAGHGEDLPLALSAWKVCVLDLISFYLSRDDAAQPMSAPDDHWRDLLVDPTHRCGQITLSCSWDEV